MQLCTGFGCATARAEEISHDFSQTERTAPDSGAQPGHPADPRHAVRTVTHWPDALLSQACPSACWPSTKDPRPDERPAMSTADAVQHTNTATPQTENDLDKPSADSDLPQRPRATAPPRVRIEGINRRVRQDIGPRPAGRLSKQAAGQRRRLPKIGDPTPTTPKTGRTCPASTGEAPRTL